ncbi:MAG: leucine--tRNA ligase [Saprospiraceae bacterium]
MEYRPQEIEKKWQQYWRDHETYKVSNNSAKPKFYILDMFPYPSGSGLHVGHPLGYIASDIFARYKRLSGFNVLHPMGYDSFGLPAEQYAIQTGTHPAVTTEKNIARYREQLDNIGFSFDWSREVRTSEPDYYKWTQWIFMQLFNHYYDKNEDKALPITALIANFAKSGNTNVNAVCDEDTPIFSAEEWNAMSEKEQQLMLLKYRFTFPEESFVNWCAALGTVLSNDEVKDGLSERGGYPVERKLMKQWSMRITAYADRLIQGLDQINWSDSLKEQQRNWIGRSQGASVRFSAEDNSYQIEVFTTRADTIYGVSFMVLAPEHELVNTITTAAQKEEVENYQKWAASRSERDRMAETKKVSGAFTGAYCINPFNGAKVPIYIADYVLAGYGTGAVMAVPSGDQRDWNFAKHFNLPIIQILDAQQNLEEAADNTKEGKYVNSGIIDGMSYKEATATLIAWLEEKGIGKGKIQYRLRNAIFSRQRYWGEPVPAYWNDGVPYLIEESELPLILPKIEKFLPTETGEPPLGRAENWKYKGKYEYELSTMPGWAGSSWYWYRYMDASNDKTFVSKEAANYWKDVDLYLGGTEHAVGHLLYSRFWNHFLYDLRLVPEKEFAKKLVNQGMIQGRSLFLNLKSGRKLHVNVNLADDKDRLFKPVYSQMITEDNRFDGIDIANDIDWTKDDSGKEYVMLTAEIEKMSKSKFNVVNPDDIVAQYGADCFRMYEMFLGPIEDAKPWSTTGISGTQGFLRKLWTLFYDVEKGKSIVNQDEPTKEQWKVLHTCIKKVAEDIERFSFNTSVAAFMICVNELKRMNCNSAKILQDLVVILAPFAPHISEELWHLLGNEGSVCDASFPAVNEECLKDDSVTYPVAINGKTRDTMDFDVNATQADIEAAIFANDKIQKHLEGAAIKKIVFVKGRMVNIVV